MGRRANRSAVGAFLYFFMELKSIQIRFNTQNCFAGWAYEIGKNRCLAIMPVFDDSELIAAVGPDPAAIATFQRVLAVTVSVQVNFNMFGTFA
jgi:hypothetical protein